MAKNPRMGLAHRDALNRIETREKWLQIGYDFCTPDATARIPAADSSTPLVPAPGQHGRPTAQYGGQRGPARARMHLQGMHERKIVLGQLMVHDSAPVTAVGERIGRS